MADLKSVEAYIGAMEKTSNALDASKTERADLYTVLSVTATLALTSAVRELTEEVRALREGRE